MMRAAGRPVARSGCKPPSTAVVVAFCTLLCMCGGAVAQSSSPSLSQVETLVAAQQWPEIARLLAPVSPRSAEMDLYLGLALAHTGRSEEAVRALDAGRRLAPRDARFPEELAGIAFQQKQYARAARLLRRAVKLAPQDEYANNFLATVYFLQDNIEAALQCWNRVGKPYVEQVSYQPEPRVSPALLDHAFAFSPAATLQLPQFYATNARIRGLGIFSQYHFDLNALPDGHFNVVFRGSELDGFGAGWLAALMVLRGLPFQQINPAIYNLRRRAINFDSMFRWDAQKRRLVARLSGPLENGATYRWNLAADLRNENWAVRNSFAGVAPVLADFNMRREAGSFEVASYAGGRWGWQAGAELSHRDFRNASAGSVLTPRILAAGYELKQTAEASAALWRVPGHRFTLSGDAGSQAARLWSRPRESFEKITGALAWRWLPQAQGDDYETTQQFRAGTTFGQVPFDELFILGLDQDNNLPMRAHIATRGGRKGSAPMGRNYFLQNWETDKNIYSNGIVRVQLGPFLDIGRIWDPGALLGSRQWLFDSGVELRLRVFGTGVAFSYGRDLRTGNNAFYAMPEGWSSEPPFSSTLSF